MLVVSAGEAEQRRRVLLRPGMTPAKLDSILARQVSPVAGWTLAQCDCGWTKAAMVSGSEECGTRRARPIVAWCEYAYF